MLLVILSDTVVDPWTVVVHSPDTATACRAMVRELWLIVLALLARGHKLAINPFWPMPVDPEHWRERGITERHAAWLGCNRLHVAVKCSAHGGIEQQHYNEI